jgi:hypothetical protein
LKHLQRSRGAEVRNEELTRLLEPLGVKPRTVKIKSKTARFHSVSADRIEEMIEMSSEEFEAEF